MTAIVYALTTVLAWGVWLAPSQTIPFKNQQIKTFYVATANLVLALVAALLQGSIQAGPRGFLAAFYRRGDLGAERPVCFYGHQQNRYCQGLWRLGPVEYRRQHDLGCGVLSRVPEQRSAQSIAVVGCRERHHCRYLDDHFCQRPR